MVKRAVISLILFALGVLILGDHLAGTERSVAKTDGEVIEGRYIVLVDPEANPYEAAAELGVSPRAYYRHAVNGFSVEVSPERAEELADAPFVTLVEPVKRVGIALHENPFQTLVEGVNRIDADENGFTGIGQPAGPDADVDIAIIDTGIDLDHADLKALAGFGAYEENLGVNEFGQPQYGPCNSGHDPQDEHGHGTHVAGTAGAIDNDIGVVGVAPGARLWAVRVLRDDGYGCDDDVIRGIDWVTDRKMEYDDGPGDGDPGINFAVANMSLGGPSSAALCTAIANSVAQGVMYAVAAGNDAGDAAGFSPANCDAAVTVSAYADYDGQSGSLAGRTCQWTEALEPDPDDSFAWFSNYGADVDIAAPGVCIMSTYPSDDPLGLYAVMRGTSMATPHVAGALALYQAAIGFAGPFDGESVLNELNAAGWTRHQDSACGFTEDPDEIPEPVLYLGSTCPNAEPTPSPSASPTASPSATATASPAQSATPSPTPSPSLSPSPTTPPLDPSDIDCDELVTGRDPLILVRFAAKIPPSLPAGCPPIGALATDAFPAQLRGDLDCNGAVDIKDALVIMRLLGRVIAEVEACAT